MPSGRHNKVSSGHAVSDNQVIHNIVPRFAVSSDYTKEHDFSIDEIIQELVVLHGVF
ncbi:MAG: hypothetical protein ABI999_14865 [Acidobacteriota bacterium]